MPDLFNPYSGAYMAQPAAFPALSLLDFTRLIRSRVVAAPGLADRWVTAELSDLSVRGHCYMDLIEKNAMGVTVARLRATVWMNVFPRISAKFLQATGAQLRSGIKVMLRGSVNFHEQYGISFNVTDIDPSYTLGDLERIRREILGRLQAEGVIGYNKSLPISLAPQRIAVISGRSAAGYGDFINQLEANPYGIVFYPHLFEAVVQGERTAPSVMAALQRIEETIDLWDCVVIIRGGGATSDLNGFDNLDLARAVATFPLPIIVGIGHERDRTVLDEIAHTRVKTPTAAAEWLVARGAAFLSSAEQLVRSIASLAQSIVAGSMRQLSQLETRLHTDASRALSAGYRRLDTLQAIMPQLASGALARASMRLDSLRSQLPGAGAARLCMERQRLDYMSQSLGQAAFQRLRAASDRLDRLAQLADALSPRHILRRGYSLTLGPDGKAVKDASSLSPGDSLTTLFASGSATSSVDAVSSSEYSEK